MRSAGRIGVRVVLGGAVALAWLGAARLANTAEPCCFANEAYTGVCRVMPGQNESCASILAYLNEPNSSGKSYCDGTAIRGGWRQATCGEKSSVPKAPVSAQIR